MNAKKIKNEQKEGGFTIIELMIALSVLATILVISTVIMVRIGSMYTRGVNAATLQNTTRTISSDLTSAIQFSGSVPQTCTIGCGSYQAICIGLERYSFLLDRKLGVDTSVSPSPTPHVLWRDTMSTPNCVPADLAATNPTANGYEMIPENVRLTELTAAEVTPGSGTYEVRVRAAYGDTDLLNAARTGCVGTSGTQYCGASRISTTVTRRIQ